MMHSRLMVSLAAVLIASCLCRAADPPAPLMTASGIIAKVDKDSVTIRPRGPDGKFEKELKLTITGTSKCSTLTSRKQAGKVVLVQKDTDAKDLAPKQAVAVIYTTRSGGAVLLSAVVQPTEK